MRGKPYWTWTCHRCGHDDNRNTNRQCLECSAQIRCESSGGHHWMHDDTYCSNGCGRMHDGTYDLSQRRDDY